MVRKIITAGKKWIDIDGEACALALAEVLSLRGEDVAVYLPESKSATVTRELRALSADADVERVADIGDEKMILVDLSNVQYLEGFCHYNLENVVEIYDHHFESFGYWQEKLGSHAHIERVGAAATLIFELAQKDHVLEHVSMTAKTLLLAGIVSNTQNFTASMTSERDHRAFDILLKDLGIDDGWVKEYFAGVEEAFWSDMETALLNDTKSFTVDGRDVLIAQAELWDAGKFLSAKKKDIEKFLEKQTTQHALFTAPSINEGKTYFVTHDSLLQDMLGDLYGVKFKSNIAEHDGIILRKEIVEGVLTYRKS